MMAMGADKNAKNAKGETPLHFAADHVLLAMVKTLVRLGVDKEAKTAPGETPLHYAARRQTTHTLRWWRRWCSWARTWMR